MKPLNYQITVIDDREGILREIHDADEKIHIPFADALNNRSIEKDAFFVIATYQHKYDGVVLNKIYGSGWQPKYVGMVASRKKQKQLIAELKKEVPDVDISRCYVPTGLNIGGSLPAEIAISIVSEMQAVANDKNAKHLRDEND